MSFAKLVAFDRPLAGVAWPGQTAKPMTDAQIAARCQTAYHAGADAARAEAAQQIVELRAEIAQLSEGVFRQLQTVEAGLLAQLHESLPSLALEIARRLLAGYEPPPEVMDRMWRESLEQLYPERENLELSLSPEDARLIEQTNPEWQQRYPGLRIRSDAALRRGDSVVRSRFGLTDSRQATKLGALEHALTGA